MRSAPIARHLTCAALVILFVAGCTSFTLVDPAGVYSGILTQLDPPEAFDTYLDIAITLEAGSYVAEATTVHGSTELECAGVITTFECIAVDEELGQTFTLTGPITWQGWSGTYEGKENGTVVQSGTFSVKRY